MVIDKIVIENFKGFKDWFTLPLNRGLNIIVGNNEAGKSTILEAINLALTGLYNGRYLQNELTQYLFNNEAIELKGISRAGFYVALTRAKYSVGIVLTPKQYKKIKGIPVY